MKKLFVLFIALALLVGVSAPAFATAGVVSSQGGGGIGTVKTYTTINHAAGYTASLVPITTIIPGKCEIVGWHINPTGSAYEGLASIRDAATVALAIDTTIINEAEGTSTIPYDQMFPKGIQVADGIVINQGPYTSVTVYYIQVRP
jgi:hypothetical protein